MAAFFAGAGLRRLGAGDASFRERFQAFALKAAREGKQETSWLNPQEIYEEDVDRFIERILDRSVSAEFLESLAALAQRVSLLGALNSLTQITLKITMPGVPDFYQGAEYWDLSFVDPDNRRSVNFTERASALSELESPDWARLVQNWSNGQLKFAWTRHLLRLRGEMASVFTYGDYVPLEVTAPYRDHVVALRSCNCCCDEDFREAIRWRPRLADRRSIRRFSLSQRLQDRGK